MNGLTNIMIAVAMSINSAETKPAPTSGFALRSRSSPEQIAKAVARKEDRLALKAEQVKKNLAFIAAMRRSYSKPASGCRS